MSAPEGVDVVTGEIAEPYRLSWEPMNLDQAKHVTTQINAYSLRLPMLVKEARDAEAWKALGCATWTEYVQDHLVISTEYARLLLRGADKLEELAAGTGIPVDLFAIPERVLRGLDTPTMVGVGRATVAELPAGTEPEERAAAVDEAVRAKIEEQKMEAAAQRGREKAAKDLAEANARREAAAQAAELERLQREEERRQRKEAEAAKTSDTGISHPPVSDAPDADPPASGASTPGKAGTDTPSDAAATGGTERSGQTAPLTDGEDGGTASSSAAVPPSLPDDWRDDVGHSTYLLRHPVAALRSALGPDERADLTALYIHLGEVLADPKQEQAA